MEDFRGLLKLVSIYLWAIVFTIPGVLLTLYKLARNKGQVIKTKERNTPPSVWNDPALGSHKYIEVNGVKLHYVAKGNPSKPLVLFLHGFPECWYSWRSQLKDLDSRNYFLVALDMRGYGDSDKPQGKENYHWEKLILDVKQVVEKLGHKKVTLVAHDWGGLVAWMFAAKNPTIIEKLIILNSPNPRLFAELFNSSWSQHFKSYYMYAFQIPLLSEYFFGLNDFNIFKRAFTGADGQQLLNEEDLEVYKYSYSNKPYSTSAPIDYYRSLIKIMKISPETLPYKVTKPTLVIWGRQDKFLSASLAEDVPKYVNNATIKFIEDAGHFVQMEQPETVNKLISDFL